MLTFWTRPDVSVQISTRAEKCLKMCVLIALPYIIVGCKMSVPTVKYSLNEQATRKSTYHLTSCAKKIKSLALSIPMVATRR